MLFFLILYFHLYNNNNIYDIVVALLSILLLDMVLSWKRSQLQFKWNHQYLEAMILMMMRYWAIPFNVHTPLWTRSIKFEPLRKKDQSADTNSPPPQKLRNFCLTPRKKRKDPMHTTPQKWLFQTPQKFSSIEGGGGCILNGMAHCRINWFLSQLPETISQI